MPELILAPLFADHLVLQRGRSNPIWGWDRPGQMMELQVEGAIAALGPATAAPAKTATSPTAAPPTPVPATAVAAADGSFRLVCPELPAGGPYRLRIRGSEELVIDDVLVGEVWLASGQSNMEWKVSASDHADREIAAAKWPSIRMFNVGRATAAEPERTADGEWRVCHPDTVHDFSAVGYFFARELHRELGVPVGIVNASWGGTPVEAWTSASALRAVMDVDAELAPWALPKDQLERLRASYQDALVRWEREMLPSDPDNEGEARGWARADHDDGDWPAMVLPGAWQSRGLPFNGAVWFRKTIELPPSWAGHDLLLSLGAIDDFDHSYFNGALVGAHPKGTPQAYQIRRLYRVSGDLVRPGENVIAVRVFDHVGEGGLIGPAMQMFAETTAPGGGRVALAGAFRYAVERRIALVSPAVFQSYPAPPPALVPEHAPAALFNGMIAPLLPFGLRGVIWYQGESNVEGHAQYARRFVAMIRDWRARFGQGALPFYFVQLANYIASPEWPYLREAQHDALREPSTGMAVTIDIGDPGDIHPRNKQEVGRRLSLLALARTYGRRDLEDSGPVLERVELGEGSARVHFSHAAGLRARDGGDHIRGFTLAGEDGVHHAASGRLRGEVVTVVSSEVAAPRSVRYAWADAPDANLENERGLAAAPFRTDRHRSA